MTNGTKVPLALAQSQSHSQSGKRDSNPRPQPWQGCALPTELFPRTTPGSRLATENQRFVTLAVAHFRAFSRRGAQRTSLSGPECHVSGGEGNRTPDLLNAIQALSQLSYAPSSYSAAVSRVELARASEQEPRSIAEGIGSVNEMGLAKIWKAGILQRLRDSKQRQVLRRFTALSLLQSYSL